MQALIENGARSQLKPTVGFVVRTSVLRWPENHNFHPGSAIVPARNFDYLIGFNMSSKKD